MDYHPRAHHAHNHSVNSAISSAMTQRACQTCGTTVTSQWRYGHSGKVLLCNACGIRWKRKNQTAGRKRLKPGPKRVRHTTSLSTRVSSYAVQPNLGPVLHHSNMNSMPNRNLSSSSSVTDYRGDGSTRSALGWPSTERKKGGGQEYGGCAKMDIRVLCGRERERERERERGSAVVRRGSVGRSPISITSLLNVAEEGSGVADCSESSVSMTRRM